MTKTKLALWSLLTILLLITTWAARTPHASASPEEVARAKIAPHVWAETEAGAESSFFLVLAEQADLSRAHSLHSKQEKGRYVYETLLATAQRSQANLRSTLEAREVPYQPFYIVNALLVRGDRTLALEMAARPDVARIEANPSINNVPPPYPYAPAPEGKQRVLAVEPGIAYVNADDVWALGFTGQNIVVGGQDTGYDWAHPALINHYRGWNGSEANHDYDWHDSIHEAGTSPCGANSLEPCDDNGHGTHTIGTAVGSDGGSNQIGMAPGAKWIGCRNMNQGVGTPATYLECFEFFLAPYPVGGTFQQGNPDLAPHVTVNSWGCPPSEGCAQDSLRAGLEAQVAAGIMTVVSAGNEGFSCSTVFDPPSHYDAAYTVGALNNGMDSLASFSSRGPVTIDGSNRVKPDISAPGTQVRSSIPGGGYANFQGTSMAGPHVSGAVALLLSARPDLIGHPSNIEAYLSNNAAPIETSDCGSTARPNNLYGYGRLNILAAVQDALDDPVLTPTATVDPSASATPTASRTPTGTPTATATQSRTPTASATTCVATATPGPCNPTVTATTTPECPDTIPPNLCAPRRLYLPILRR